MTAEERAQGAYEICEGEGHMGDVLDGPCKACVAAAVRAAENAALERAASECDAMAARREAQVAAMDDGPTRTVLTSIGIGGEICALRIRSLKSKDGAP